MNRTTPLRLITAAALAAPLMAAAASLCDTGRQQSPIDITTTQRAALPALKPAYVAGPLQLVNDGHTVRVRYHDASRLMLGAQALRLNQFHFHRTGGDRLHGEDFPLALHFLHKDAAGRLVALVALFRLGAEHPGLAALLPHLPAPGAPEQRLADVRFDPASLLPPALGYYAYDGSETAPPCREGVRWLVLRTLQTLSAAQLARLQALIPPNARPVQPLNGRTVVESP